MYSNTRDLYDTLADDFHRSRGKNPWKDLVAFNRFLKQKGLILARENALVLDAGCGNGRNATILAGEDRGTRYVGIDFSRALIEIAKQHAGTDWRREFLQASMTHLPFRAGSFDLLACIAAFHHLLSKEAMRSVLAGFHAALDGTEGRLLFSTWRKWQGRFRKQVVKNLVKAPRDEGTGEKLERGVVTVPWKHSRSGITHLRKYYLLSKRELSNLFKNRFQAIFWKELGGPGGKDNHFVYLDKK